MVKAVNDGILQGIALSTVFLVLGRIDDGETLDGFLIFETVKRLQIFKIFFFLCLIKPYSTLHIHNGHSPQVNVTLPWAMTARSSTN
jgi:hypothetical protein